MPHPTKDEFVQLLRTTSRRDVVRENVFGGIPYVFRDAPGDYEALRDHLSSTMSIQKDNIAVVGSGKVGFSLAPDTFGIPFGPHSDIDVLVVSEMLFDGIWLELLRLPRLQFAQLSRRDKQEIHEHRERQIYWGRIWPENLLRVSRSAKLWVDAFRSLSRNPHLAYFEIKGRLYRTWDHAQVYHEDGLAQLSFILRRGPESGNRA